MGKVARKRAVKDPFFTNENLLEVLTIDQWLSLHSKITESEQRKYPNAKKAAELKASPLYKALK